MSEIQQELCPRLRPRSSTAGSTQTHPVAAPYAIIKTYSPLLKPMENRQTVHSPLARKEFQTLSINKNSSFSSQTSSVASERKALEFSDPVATLLKSQTYLPSQPTKVVKPQILECDDSIQSHDSCVLAIFIFLFFISILAMKVML